jgi:serine/threonine protein kinase
MLEYMDGGSLENIVAMGGTSDEPTIASIAIQALKGVAFLHSCSQMHRDIKPGNFLISRTGAVKGTSARLLLVCSGGAASFLARSLVLSTVL